MPARNRDPFYFALGERIAAARRERGLTQVQLAQRAGLDDSQLSKVEHGRHATTLLVVRKVARALGVPPASLVPPDEEDLP